MYLYIPHILWRCICCWGYTAIINHYERWIARDIEGDGCDRFLIYSVFTRLEELKKHKISPSGYKARFEIVSECYFLCSSEVYNSIIVNPCATYIGISNACFLPRLYSWVSYDSEVKQWWLPKWYWPVHLSNGDKVFSLRYDRNSKMFPDELGSSKGSP